MFYCPGLLYLLLLLLLFWMVCEVGILPCKPLVSPFSVPSPGISLCVTYLFLMRLILTVVLTVVKITLEYQSLRIVI